MKRKVNINVGVSSSAKEFLEQNAQKTIASKGSKTSVVPVKELDRRFGNLNDICLHRYKLSNGSLAKEFVQCKLTVEEGATFVFIGLETESERFLWKTSKINEEIKWRSLN